MATSRKTRQQECAQTSSRIACSARSRRKSFLLEDSLNQRYLLTFRTAFFPHSFPVLLSSLTANRPFPEADCIVVRGGCIGFIARNAETRAAEL